MPHNTLYNLVKVLKAPEMNEVSAYFSNKYNGAKKHHRLCFVSLRKAMKSKKGLGGLTNEKLFADSFGNEDYSDVKLRRLRLETRHLIENFLAAKQLKKSENLRSILITESLNERKHPDFFKAFVLKRIKSLEKQDEKGKAYYHELATLYYYLYYHAATKRLDIDNDCLQLHIENLENYFVLAYLESAVESILKGGVINSNEHFDFLDIVAKSAERKRSSIVIKSILLFYNLYSGKGKLSVLDELKEKDNDEKYGFLKKMQRSERQLTLKLLAHQINSSSKMDKEERNQELFELYRQSFEDASKKILKGTIDPVHFLNTIVIAGKAGEYPWGRVFQGMKLRYLPSEERSMAKNISEAILCFYEGVTERDKAIKYRIAIDHLEAIPDECDENYSLRKHSLTVRIHFELGSSTSGFNQLKSGILDFKEYLKENKILTALKKDGYNYFLEKLSELADFTNTTKPTYDRYVKQLLAGRNFPFRDWLVEKAEGLK